MNYTTILAHTLSSYLGFEVEKAGLKIKYFFCTLNHTFGVEGGWLYICLSVSWPKFKIKREKRERERNGRMSTWESRNGYDELIPFEEKALARRNLSCIRNIEAKKEIVFFLFWFCFYPYFVICYLSFVYKCIWELDGGALRESGA